MGFDINKYVQQRLGKLQGKTKVRENLWKPTKGKTRIRIVPYKFNDGGLPFIELYFHYNIGRQTLLSPVSFGDPDPIDEFAKKLMNTGDSDDWNFGRKFQPKLRTYVPVVLRNEDGSVNMDEGVKFWGFGKTIFETLLNYMSDPDYGDITDPVTGRDIEVEFIPPKDGEKWGETKLIVKPNVTPLTDDKAEFDKIIESQVEITDIYQKRTYEELETALHTHMNPDESISNVRRAMQANGGAGTNGSTDAPTPTPVAESATEEAVGTAPLEDTVAQFRSMFNK